MDKPKEIIEIEEIYGITIKEIAINEILFSKQNTFRCDANRNITGLNLFDNQISEIKGLDKLNNLTKLYLSDNQISEIKGLDKLNNLTSLYLSDNQISEIKGLDELINLTELSLTSNQISEIKGLDKLKNLTSLFLPDNQISEIKGLDKLNNLTKLYLFSNQISEIKGLEKLNNLKLFYLSDNQISEIKGLDKLNNLKLLYLNSNHISEIKGLDKLNNLIELYLSYNQISEIKGLDKLNNLTKLYLDSNLVTNIDSLKFIYNLNNIEYLRINNNPFKKNTYIDLQPNVNHFYLIKNELEKIDKKRASFILPCKVMLLGNHSVGKSSFLHYFLTGKPKKKEMAKSTDILDVCRYPEDSKTELPEAFFFDFGGQDYYHGIYRAFFTSNAINILFWNTETDINDSLPGKDKLLTTHFDRDYWIGQISHKLGLYSEKSAENKQEEKIFVIQTYADTNMQNERKIKNYQRDHHDSVQQEFYISLDYDILVETDNSNDQSKNEEIPIKSKKNKYQLSLEHLVQSIKDEIDNRERKEKTQNEIDLYEYIYNQKGVKSVKIDDLMGIYKLSKDALRGQLSQLARKGMVLYYDSDEFNSKEDPLRDFVWLNPAATVKMIHDDILNKDIIRKKQGRVLVNDFMEICEVDNNLFEMLIREKVIFEDKKNNPDKKDNTSEIIIPGYLPLSKDDDDLFWFKQNYMQYRMTLKFKSFIPFGLINQLICYYGKNPDNKKYYRDLLLFTHEKLKVSALIQLDFEHLEIIIHIAPKSENDIKSIEAAGKVILDDILDMYWGDPKYEIDSDEFELYMLSKERKRQIIPNDLYISLDSKFFVSLSQLDNEEDLKKILFYQKDSLGNLLNEGQSGDIFQFKNITNNKVLSSSKKIFISYSRHDKDCLLELKKYLRDFNPKLDIYYDEKTELGNNIHTTILKEIMESDYVFALVSQNFLDTDYIRNIELPEIKKLNKKLIPIIIRPCLWERVFTDFSPEKGNRITMKNDNDSASDNERQQNWVNLVKELESKIAPGMQDSTNSSDTQKNISDSELASRKKSIYMKNYRNSEDGSIFFKK